MNKSAKIEQANMNNVPASEERKEEFRNVKSDYELMAKLNGMKGKIELLQKELNYELQQLQLVKNQNSGTAYSTPPLMQPYTTYSNSNFPQQNLYTNYPTAPYWSPTPVGNYYQDPYKFGFENRSEAQAAFYSSLEKVDQMCSNEIRNTTQDICNIKEIKRKWMHCQPFNNLGSPAGDDLLDINGFKPTTNHLSKDKLYGFQFKGPDKRDTVENSDNRRDNARKTEESTGILNTEGKPCGNSIFYYSK